MDISKNMSGSINKKQIYEKKSIIKITVRQAVSFISILIMIYASADSMWFAMHKKVMFGIAVINFFLLTTWNILHKKNVSRELFLDYLFFVGLIMVSMVFNLDFTGYTQWFFAMLAVLLVCTADFETFCRQFNAIVVWLCIFSLAGMYIYMNRLVLLDGASTIRTTITAKNLWITCIPLNYTPQTFRNYGIFYEPGKFAIYIGIALFIQMYVMKKISLMCIGIYLLTLLTTRSTTGITAVGFLLCLWLLTGRGGRYRVILFLGLSLAMLYIITLRGEWISEFFSKFDTHGAAADSVNSRLASLLVGIWIGILQPFTGAGAVKSQILFVEIASKYFNTSCYANMVTYLFSAFGALFLCFLLIGLWGIGIQVCQDKRKACGIMLFFVLLYGGQISTYSHCFYALVFYGWSYLHRHGLIVWDRAWVKIS